MTALPASRSHPRVLGVFAHPDDETFTAVARLRGTQRADRPKKFGRRIQATRKTLAAVPDADDWRGASRTRFARIAPTSSLHSAMIAPTGVCYEITRSAGSSRRPPR
jgi:hypothetical protein